MSCTFINLILMFRLFDLKNVLKVKFHMCKAQSLPKHWGFPVELSVKFSLTPDLQSKTSLKVKFTGIFVDG